MPVELWTSQPFLDAATAWVADAVRPWGINLSGERDQPHARPWSSAVRFGSDEGALWFKVNGPGTAHEAALTAVLAAVVPAMIPQLLAVDAARGWSLMRDAGPVLRTVATPDLLWERWAELLKEYAEAQVVLSAHGEQLLATGVDDLRPDAMPARLAGLVEDLRRLPEDEGGLTDDQADGFVALLPEFASWCAELGESGVAPSINHDDLHSSNICVGADGMRIIDWGDAVVSHPFLTMLATLNSIAWHAGTSRTDPQVERIRDAYLEPFSAYGSHTDLVRWVGLARRTGCLSRALSYLHAFEGEPLAAQAAEDWPVRGWLLELLP